MEKEKQHLGMRQKLMLALCGMSFLVLGVLWFATSRLLQPAYNQYISKSLTTRLDSFAALFDAASDNGQKISSRDFGVLTLNSEFWEGVNKAVSDGQIRVSDCCVDVSDTTLRSVNYVENVHPCILHEGDSPYFGGLNVTSRDTSAIIALRQEVFQWGSIYKICESATGQRQMVVGRLVADGQYAIILSTGLVRVGEAGIVMGRIMPLMALLLFIVAVALSWLLSRWIASPLVRLSAAARKVANGDYDVHVEEEGDDEMSLLARDFNHMASEVKQSSQMQKELLANVSHDLRTPLTLIKGYAETVRDISGDDKTRRDEQMNIIVDEADRLSGLVNSVMEFSKVSTGTEKPEKVRFDMSELCEEVAERYEALCEKNGWQLTLELEPAQVYADPGMMERVLHNLLGNATHHLGEDKTFLLRTRALPGGCRVEVTDHGPGIPAEDLPHIFDRYYRSRKDAGKAGAGLGLAITRAIFQSHGFRFGVSSTLGKGSTFWFIMTDKDEPKPPDEGEKHRGLPWPGRRAGKAKPERAKAEGPGPAPKKAPGETPREKEN